VHDYFLVFTQTQRWLDLLNNTIAERWPQA
jgi:hypothetical protein